MKILLTGEFLTRIEKAADAAELLSLHQEFGQLLMSRHVYEEPVRELAMEVQNMHDQMVRRSLELTALELQKEGYGQPNCRFAWLALGSSARGEQTLWTDQDNALIFEPGELSEEACSDYFKAFSERAARNLDAAGYPLCKGFVMAANPRWRGTMGDWEGRIQRYLALQDWDNIRFLLIAADMRPVVGDVELGKELRHYIVEQISRQGFLLWMAADHGQFNKVALGLLNRIQTDLFGDHAGELNIKEGFHNHLVNAIRLWALSNQIDEPSTFARIEQLAKRGVWEETLSAQIQQAMEISLTLRFQHPFNYVKINDMESESYQRLLRALKVTKQLQAYTSRHFAKPG